MARGKFISFEGPEGSGKSTHAKRLADQLRAQGYTVIQTREPGGTKLGEYIREVLQFNAAGETPLPRAELLLFLACRAQIIDQVIEPALVAGTWVICDRFCDSTVAYQGYGRELGAQTVAEINDFATNHLMPDMTIFLDISEKESVTRLNRRGETDRFESEAGSFHQRVRQGFYELHKAYPERIKLLNTAKDVTTIDAEILDLIATLKGE